MTASSTSTTLSIRNFPTGDVYDPREQRGRYVGHPELGGVRDAIHAQARPAYSRTTDSTAAPDASHPVRRNAALRHQAS